MSRRRRKFKKQQQPENIIAMNEFVGGETKKTFTIHDLRNIKPMTQAQKDVFECYCGSDDNLFLSGSAGTGKTFLATYLALQDIFDARTKYNRVVIVRSIVPVRDIGYLPGRIDEKIEVYEQPYIAICDELFPYKKSYKNLKESGYISFIPTSFIRGLTLDNCIVIVEEAENMVFQELDSIITRAGRNTKFIFCGDAKQSDLQKYSDKKGYTDFMQIIERMDSFSIIDFLPEDIVRSGMVKEYIMAKEIYS